MSSNIEILLCSVLPTSTLLLYFLTGSIDQLQLFPFIMRYSLVQTGQSMDVKMFLCPVVVSISTVIVLSPQGHLYTFVIVSPQLLPMPCGSDTVSDILNRSIVSLHRLNHRFDKCDFFFCQSVLSIQIFVSPCS